MINVSSHSHISNFGLVHEHSDLVFCEIHLGGEGKKICFFLKQVYVTFKLLLLDFKFTI